LPSGPPFAQQLSALPAPTHLHEYLTRSLHLHFGYFESSTDPLAQAQDRLILRSARLLTRNSMVADVGCGLGGAVNLLAAQGHRLFGLDPCVRSIAYARTRVSSPRAQFLACDLQQFAARARGARFDAVFLTEVLPYFPDLNEMLAHCRAVLRPGGLVVVHDVMRAPGSSPDMERFHPRGALRSAADAIGFDLVESREVSNRTSPTLPRLARMLGERREELLNVFGATRPTVLHEIAQYQAHLRALEHGFAQEELFRALDLKLVHVPYQGMLPAVTDMIGNNIQTMFVAAGTGLPAIKDGKIRAVAITGGERLPQLPDVAVIKETYPTFDHTEWFAIVAPPKTPAYIVEELSKGIAAAMAEPDVQERIKNLALTPIANSPAEAAKFIAAERVRWKAIVEARRARGDQPKP
jgi:SAM-dependent methyltransferase